jgi:molecular chaperone DnaK (HSP70)
MTDAPARFAIGIDLGTTNCALAWAPSSAEMSAPTPMSIPQIVALGEVASRPLLPSFLYFPAAAELPADALGLPWYPNARDAVGVFARAQGATTPLRLVSSAKSWLSNPTVDRRGEILPWGAPEDMPKVSPLQASARYLAHLRAAWEQEHPDEPLQEQDVVLTVPASFDAVARELTMEAAALAGLEDPILLEEPQAALYDWVAQRGTAWRSEVAVGDHILVVDIGGGTTDFSLIAVRDEDGTLQLERVAVGDHILLGGDNMDLALAHAVKARLDEAGTRLDDWQMRALTHACRTAKEALLSDDAPGAQPLVIPSRGSKLVGGSIRTELTRADVEAVLLGGFFPVVEAQARPQTPRRVGLTALGLPYASDAAVTRHLAAFLGRARAVGGEEATTFVHPTAVLFNGGVTRSPVVRDRILEVLSAWIQAEGGHPRRCSPASTRSSRSLGERRTTRPPGAMAACGSAGGRRSPTMSGSSAPSWPCRASRRAWTRYAWRRSGWRKAPRSSSTSRSAWCWASRSRFGSSAARRDATTSSARSSTPTS